VQIIIKYNERITFFLAIRYSNILRVS
jgi:hypothetical protein